MNIFRDKFTSRFGADFFSFISHGKNYLLGEFLSKGIAFISLPILTRLLLPEEYGIISIYISIVSVFSIVSGLGIRGAIGRYYYEKNDDFPEFIGTNIYLFLIFNILFIFIVYLLSGTIVSFIKADFSVLYLALIVAVINAFIQYYLAFLIASKKSLKYTVLNASRQISGITLAIILIIVLNDNKYFGFIYGQLASAFCIFIYVGFTLYKISKFHFRIKHVKYALLFGVPIMFHLLSQFILQSFDILIINQLIGRTETGLYAFAYHIGMIQQVITLGLSNSWRPIFYEKMNDGDHDGIEKLLKKFSFIIASFAVFLILFSKEIVMIVADKSYYESFVIIPIVVIGYLFFFFYMIYAQYTFYRKKTHLIAVFTLIAGLINIGLNYLLIPKFGYIAAAYTTLISYLCLFLLHTYNVKFILKEKRIYPFWKLLSLLIPVLGAASIFYLCNHYIVDDYIGFFIKLIAAAAYALIILRKI